MEYKAYLQSNNIISEETIASALTAAAIQRETLFEQLLKNYETYNLKEEDVLDSFSKSTEGTVSVIESTKSLSSYIQGYKILGGVDLCTKKQIISLANDEEKSILFVVNRPDDEPLMNQIEKSMNGTPYSLGVCSKFIYDSLYTMFIQPLLVEDSAKKLIAAEASKFGNNDYIRHESEVRRIYMQILDLGYQRGASDIHIMPKKDTTAVIYRIDGTNFVLFELHKSIGDRICNILCTDGGVARRGDMAPADGKIQFVPTNENTPIDLRFSILPTIKGTDINIRYLSSKIFSFEQLGMTKKNIELYKSLLMRPQGLIVQIGPTGSGKSTTMACGINFISKVSLRTILTVEDPPEIYMDGITQVAVNPMAGLTFASAVRQFLRHDVDVAVVGEIRDEETALEAVRAATTGHLVISSLHANDSIGVFERLFRLSVDSYTLGDILVAIMSQRLVRRLCPYCKEKYTLDLSSEKARHFRIPQKEGTMTFYKAVGCEHCHNIGYVGRVAVNEIMQIDPFIRHHIQVRSPRSTFEKYLKTQKYLDMYTDALNKARAGITSLEEIEPMCNDTLAFKLI